MIPPIYSPPFKFSKNEKAASAKANSLDQFLCDTCHRGHQRSPCYAHLSDFLRPWNWTMFANQATRRLEMTGWQPHCLDLFCHTLQKEVPGYLRKILFILTKPRKTLICCRKWQRCEFQCRWVGLPRWLHSSKPWSMNDMIEIHRLKIRGVKKAMHLSNKESWHNPLMVNLRTGACTLQNT